MNYKTPAVVISYCVHECLKNQIGSSESVFSRISKWCMHCTDLWFSIEKED